MSKKIVGLIKLNIVAGKANPAPPIGPALGQKGLNIMEFCKNFNAKTQGQEGYLRVRITAYVDRTFTYEILGAPTTDLIKKITGFAKGSNAPGRSFLGKITEEQIRKVAEEKMKYGTSARDIDATMKIVVGCARSMGLKVEGINA